MHRDVVNLREVLQTAGFLRWLLSNRVGLAVDLIVFEQSRQRTLSMYLSLIHI